MKVLLIGSNFHNYVESVADACRRIGYDVRVYMPKVYWEKSLLGRLHYKCSTILNSMRKLKTKVYIKPEFIRNKESALVLDIYNEYKPDTVIDFSSYFLEPFALKQMTKSRNVIWIYDAMERLPHLDRILSLYDNIYYFEGSDSEYFEKHHLKANFLPLCADDKIYFPIDCNKDIDVSFVGNLSHERIQFLLKLKYIFPNLNIKVYGRVPMFYEFMHKNGNDVRKYKDMFLNEYISPKEANKLYSRSKICINVHNGQTKYGANMRFFEIMAAGGFQLVDRNPYIIDNFQNCMECYNDFDDLTYKINSFINNDKVRDSIGRNAYYKVKNCGCFIHRVKNILDS